MKGCEKRGKLDMAEFLSMVESLTPGALEAVMPKMAPRQPVKSHVQQDIVDAALARRRRRAERFKKTLPEII